MSDSPGGVAHLVGGAKARNADTLMQVRFVPRPTLATMLATAIAALTYIREPATRGCLCLAVSRRFKPPYEALSEAHSLEDGGGAK